MTVKVTMTETVTFYANVEDKDTLDAYLSHHLPRDAYEEALYSKTKFNGVTIGYYDDYEILPDDTVCDYTIK